MLKRAHDCRKTAENAAKALLMKLDGSCVGAYAVTGCSVQPWESLSSNSHTRYLWLIESVNSKAFAFNMKYMSLFSAYLSNASLNQSAGLCVHPHTLNTSVLLGLVVVFFRFATNSVQKEFCIGLPHVGDSDVLEDQTHIVWFLCPLFCNCSYFKKTPQISNFQKIQSFPLGKLC